MFPLNNRNLVESETKVLYRVWQGQLFIQNQQVCDIALRSPSSGSIPAQIPAKLEIRYIIDASKLREKYPEAALGKNTCINVGDRGILFSLYEVELLNKDKVKVDRLIKHLKEKDLALVKSLNDHGMLLLLTSSAWLKGKDSEPDEFSSCLLALFVISSQNAEGLTAKDLICKPEDHERTLQVALVLPGLHYALEKVVKHPDKEGSPPGTLVQWHIQNFAKVGQDSLSFSDKLDSLPSYFDMFLKQSDLEAFSEKRPPNSLSCLQFYLSEPSNFTLELAAAVACFGDNSCSSSSGRVCDVEKSMGLCSDLQPLGDGELVRLQNAPQSNQYSKYSSLKTSQISDWYLLQKTRKSSRLKANSRKKWSSLKALCNLESCKKRTLIRKKKTNLFIPSSKITRPPTDSDGPTVKLKNLQCQREKRGAEVLSAEFVQKPRTELVASEGIEQKKSWLFKNIKDLKTGKVTSEVKIKNRQPIKKNNILCKIGVSSLECQREAGIENDSSDKRTATQDVCQRLGKNEYDSHALNMLADLALSSCNSDTVNNGNTSSLPCSPSQECHRLQKGNTLQKFSECHRVTKKQKDTPISVRTQPPFLSSGNPDLSAESLFSSHEKDQVNHRKKKCVRPSLTKSHTVLVKKAGDISDSGMPSLISSEHSYATTVLELSKKQPPLKGVHSSLNSKNGVKNDKSNPLVGKVLPFRPQQNICQLHKQLRSYVPLGRFVIMSARQKEDFSKFHRVICTNETMKVTCQWEAEYLFSLDSKYTNNPLEKTVIRAVHGPWDVSSTDDVEETKLILHMWVALFYRRQISSPAARRVVEHNNSAKFVSLKSVVDNLEPLDDHGGSFSLEKCPADSVSEVDQGFNPVEETECPSSEKPLSCNELSSTNCKESEPPFLCVEKSSDLPLKDDQVGTTTSHSEAIHSFDKEAGEDSEGIIVLDSVIYVNCSNDRSSHDHIDQCLRSQVHRTDVEAKANQAVNFAAGSQSDTTSSVPPLPLEDLTDKQLVANSKTAALVGSQEIDIRALYVEEMWCCQTSSVGSPNVSEDPWLKTSVECKGGDGPCGEVENVTGVSINGEKDIDGESLELESIDLVLSESNDNDSEHGDIDLDEEHERLPEKSFMTFHTEATSVLDVASSNDSPVTLITLSATVSVDQEFSNKEMELHGNQNDPVVSALSSPALNQRGLVECFHPLQEDQGENGVDLTSQQACAVHQTTLEEVPEPLKSDDSVILAKQPIFPNQMDVVKSFSICHNEGINLNDSPSWQGSPVHLTTSDEEAELSGNKENVVVSMKPSESPNQITFIEDIIKEKMAEEFHLIEAASLQASDSDKLQSSAVTQEEWEATQIQELQNSSPDTKEKCSLGLNSLVPEAKVEDENTADLSVTQEGGCGGDKQITVTLSEDIRSLLNELIDKASGVTMVNEETHTKVNSVLNWMESIILECDTHPECDVESYSTDHVLIANEHFIQNSIFDDQMTDFHATLQEQAWCYSTLHESVRSDQANMIERGLVQENHAAPIISSCTERARIGTRSLKCSASVAQTPLTEAKDSSVSAMLEVDVGPASYKASISERDQLQEACVEILSYVPGEHHIAYSSKDSDFPMHVNSGESFILEDSENPFGEQLVRERAQLPIRAMNADMYLEYKTPSAETEQEPFGDPPHRIPHGNSFTGSTDASEATGPNYVCDLNPEEEICKTGNWMYLENKREAGIKSVTKKYDGPSIARKGDKSISSTLDIDNVLGPLKDISKKHKDKSRTFHFAKRGDTFVNDLGLKNLLSRTWRVWDDPIQNTLDMECLCFHYKLKEILAQNNSQLSTCSNIRAKDFSAQGRAKTLSLRGAVTAAPAPNLPDRSESPFLIRIINPGARKKVLGCFPRSSTYTDFLEPPPALTVTQYSVGKAAGCQCQEQEPFSPFHLNKLTYNNKLKDSRGDTSVIMDKFAELSKAKLGDKVAESGNKQMSNKGKDPSSNSVCASAPGKKCPSLPQRIASYVPLFTEFCSTLHFRLKNVVKGACKTPYMFYLVETDDDPFFWKLKILLKKGGHTEAEPLHFFKTNNPDTDRLKVIIRNEDIFPYVYKIPSLLRLKHHPHVMFLGVDSPEDVLDNTCQELFHSGGFVVSDKNVLQAMTVGELKDTIKILEHLNGCGRWTWLLHFKETKKLQEDTRVDSAAHTKDMILKSCQGTNIEILHYHQCDSKSIPQSEYLKCLLKLKVQHIQRRFAVFLTEKPKIYREVLERKGILALDVSTFIETAEGMVDPFRSGCW